MPKPYHRLSASQFKTYTECPTKWFFEKVLGYRSPGSKATELGGLIHAIIERKLVFGVALAVPHNYEWSVDVDLTTKAKEQAQATAVSTAKQMFVHLPERADREDVETLIDNWVPKGWLNPIKGFIDLVERHLNRITDHKSTGNLSYGQRSEATLRSDVQAIIYSAYAYEVLGFPDGLTFRHVYGQTKGRVISAVTEVMMSREHVQERMNWLKSIAADMQALTAETDPARVPYNEHACGNYGGCSHRFTCAAIGRHTGITAPKKVKKDNHMGNMFDRARAAKKTTPTALATAQDLDKHGQSPRDIAYELNAQGIPCQGQSSLWYAHDVIKLLGKPSHVNPPDGTPVTERVPVPVAKVSRAKLRVPKIGSSWDGELESAATKLKANLLEMHSLLFPGQEPPSRVDALRKAVKARLGELRAEAVQVPWQVQKAVAGLQAPVPQVVRAPTAAPTPGLQLLLVGNTGTLLGGAPSHARGSAIRWVSHNHKDLGVLMDQYAFVVVGS